MSHCEDCKVDYFIFIPSEARPIVLFSYKDGSVPITAKIAIFSYSGSEQPIFNVMTGQLKSWGWGSRLRNGKGTHRQTKYISTSADQLLATNKPHGKIGYRTNYLFLAWRGERAQSCDLGRIDGAFQGESSELRIRTRTRPRLRSLCSKRQETRVSKRRKQKVRCRSVQGWSWWRTVFAINLSSGRDPLPFACNFHHIRFITFSSLPNHQEQPS